jgi:dTDP-4-dehydrorhamnose reductase
MIIDNDHTVHSKVNIIGGNSIIGSFLYGQLKKYFIINGTYFNHQSEQCKFYLDITDRNSIEKTLPFFDDSTVIFLSALKNIKACEENYELAYKLNTIPIKYIIEIIQEQKLNIKLLFFSTDYVFEGNTGYYAPHSPINPKTNYGKTKAAAEQLLANSSLEFKIVRTSAVIGLQSPFFLWLKNAIEDEIEISLYNNVYFTPTPINFLSDMIINVIKNYKNVSDRILHIVGEQRFSRYEFAEKINHLLKGNGKFVSVEKDLSDSTFQYDLSLVQSSCIKDMQKKGVTIYLTELCKTY